MATPAHRLIQDQNQNFLYNGTTPGGKTDVTKAGTRGGALGGRKALNDISNSRNPSALPSMKKDSFIKKDPATVKGKSSKAAEKGRVGGRKALGDLTNSAMLRPKQIPKLNAVAEEGFLHNHQECIKAQMKTVDKDYFLKTVGLANDIAALPSPRKAPPPICSKKLKHSTTEEMLLIELPSCCSPACRSPQSPKAPYAMNWEDDCLSDLMTVIDSPKLM